MPSHRLLLMCRTLRLAGGMFAVAVSCCGALGCSGHDDGGAGAGAGVDAADGGGRGGSGASGSSGSSGASGSGYPARDRVGSCFGVGTVCTDGALAAYEDCVLSSCMAELTAVYGGVPKPGVYAGACAAATRCQGKCDCSDDACYGDCTPLATAECSKAVEAYSLCTFGCSTPQCVKPAVPVDIGCVKPSVAPGPLPAGDFVGGCFMKAKTAGEPDTCYMWSSPLAAPTEDVMANCEAMGDTYCQWGCPAKNALGACYGQRTGVDEWNVYYGPAGTDLSSFHGGCVAWTDHYQGVRFTKP